jgi:S-(hydroxymethyl)glutathione dehydrogenase/alcohol dehydrogenase
MKAAVFHKIGDIRYETVDDPKIEKEDDLILRITSTAICGSDLHILDGFIPQMRDMVVGQTFTPNVNIPIRRTTDRKEI